MTDPARHIALGDPAALREFVGECATLMRITCEIAERQAEIGDDIGLTYAMRRLRAYLRAASGPVAELNEMRKPAAEPEAA